MHLREDLQACLPALAQRLQREVSKRNEVVGSWTQRFVLSLLEGYELLDKRRTLFRIVFVSINLNIGLQESTNFRELTSRKTDDSVTSRFLSPFQLLNRAPYRDVYHVKEFKQRLEHLRSIRVRNRVNDNLVATANQSRYGTVKPFEEFGRGGRTKFLVAQFTLGKHLRERIQRNMKVDNFHLTLQSLRERRFS